MTQYNNLKLKSSNSLLNKLKWEVKNDNSSANIKLSKTQLHKAMQSGGYLARLLGAWLKPSLSLIKNISWSALYTRINKIITVALAATDAFIQKKTFGSAMTTLLFSYEDLNDIMKIVS